MIHVVHIVPDEEDPSDPFSRVGDTHSWECSCGAATVRDPLAFKDAVIHLHAVDGPES